MFDYLVWGDRELLDEEQNWKNDDVPSMRAVEEAHGRPFEVLQTRPSFTKRGRPGGVAATGPNPESKTFARIGQMHIGPEGYFGTKWLAFRRFQIPEGDEDRCGQVQGQSRREC